MADTSRVPLLSVEGLKKYYTAKSGMFSRSAGVVRAVDGVSFQLFEGETLGLVGESGCGKSTLGRQLVGLEHPTGGRVVYDGHDLGHMSQAQMKPFRTQLQMIFQDSYSSLNPRKHVFEILAEPMLYHGLAKRGDVYSHVERLLDMVGLPKNCLGRYPHEFSGGQRQRIGIARALSLNPRLLVCDEPVSALDVSIQAQVLNLMQDLQEQMGLTYLFITHDLSVVKHLSDDIVVMYLGQLVERAKPDELFEHPLHPYTQALLSAIPIPDPTIKMEREILNGELSSPINMGDGCRFAKRCPKATPECTRPIREVEASPGHFVSCHLLCKENQAGS